MHSDAQLACCTNLGTLMDPLRLISAKTSSACCKLPALQAVAPPATENGYEATVQGIICNQQRRVSTATMSRFARQHGLKHVRSLYAHCTVGVSGTRENGSPQGFKLFLAAFNVWLCQPGCASQHFLLGFRAFPFSIQPLPQDLCWFRV